MRIIQANKSCNFLCHFIQNYFPIIFWNWDIPITIIFQNENAGVLIFVIRIFKNSLCSRIYCYRSIMSKRIFLTFLHKDFTFLYKYLLFSHFSCKCFQLFPISIVKRLKLWGHIEKIIGCILFRAFNEGRMGAQVTSGQKI